MQDAAINYSKLSAEDIYCSRKTVGIGMDLFEYMREQNMESESPLASRMRPTSLDEVVGQQHIVGKDKLLYRAIKADKLSSIIFYGPPGTGKTTLAKVIANTTSAEFMQINATSSGKKDMEEVVAAAKNNQGMYGKKTILLSMRFTGLTRDSRIICFHLWKMEPLY